MKYDATRRSILRLGPAAFLTACASRHNPLAGSKLKLVRLTNHKVVVLELDGSSAAPPHFTQFELGGYTGAWDIAGGRMFFALPNSATPDSRILAMTPSGRVEREAHSAGWISRVAASVDGRDVTLLTRSTAGGTVQIRRFSFDTGKSVVLVTRLMPPHQAAGSAHPSLAWSKEQSLLAYCDHGLIDLIRDSDGSTIDQMDGAFARFSPHGKLAYAQGEALCIREADGRTRRLIRDHKLIGVHGWLTDEKTILISERIFAIKPHHYARWTLLNVDDGAEFQLPFGEVPHHLVLNG